MPAHAPHRGAGIRASDSLLTTEFLVVNAVLFLNYCNVALFFSYHKYLSGLPIDPRWSGFLISVFSLTGLAVRPVISPLLNQAQSVRWTAWGTAGVIAALLLYGFAQNLGEMIAVRMFHGFSHCVMAAALMTMFVAAIPPNRSGQAFGVVSIVALTPYAVIPPALDPLETLLGSFPNLLVAAAALMAVVFPILRFAPLEKVAPTVEAPRLSAYEIAANFCDPPVASLLGIGLIVWTTFAPVFFFLHEYGDTLGVSRPGWFFTISTIGEISVRAIGGRMFDRGNKALLLGASTLLAASGFGLLALIPNEPIFLIAALLMGLGWGVAMPAMNGLLFDVSEAKFRGLNANMSVQMFQGGLVIGPFFGGMILAGFGYRALFLSCVAVLLAATVLSALLVGNASAGRRKEKS
jgi:predicted MFS family arabinose efflux permease